jgi:uncharacterized damage-inducible protein DinB
MMEKDLRYPVGVFNRPSEVTPEMRSEFVATIALLPREIREATNGLADEKLDTPYRPQGWTIRQVVHHVGDSHLNSFCRFKLGLTEDVPVIRAYDEAKWAEAADYKMPIAVSLDLIEAIHGRWVVLLESMTAADYQRTISHPESGLWNLGEFLALYAWHCRHHLGHINAFRLRAAL